MADTTYLDIGDALALAAEFLGEEPLMRDLGLLGSALARPAASAFGADAYPDIWFKAAALIQSVVINHPLVDGNKRLGWVCARTFLILNGVDSRPIDVDAAESFVLTIATGDLSEVDEIAAQLQSLLRGAGG